MSKAMQELPAEATLASERVRSVTREEKRGIMGGVLGRGWWPWGKESGSCDYVRQRTVGVRDRKPRRRDGQVKITSSACLETRPAITDITAIFGDRGFHLATSPYSIHPLVGALLGHLLARLLLYLIPDVLFTPGTPSILCKV